MKSVSVVALVSVLGLLCTAAPVRADGFVVPALGVNFGGDARKTLVGAAQDGSNLSFDVAVGAMTAGIFGVEEDFSYAPNFYGQGGSVNSTRVVTLMTNLIIGIPIGGQKGPGFRPYATAGVGLLNRNVDAPLALSTFSANDFGYDVGVGAMGYFSNHIGMRAGVQYFRSFQRTDDNAIGLGSGHFNFFRGTIGVLFRF